MSERLRRSRCWWQAVISLAVALAGIVGPARVAIAQAPPPSPPPGPSKEHPLTGQEITPAMQAAVEKGLEALARRQAADGSFGGAGMGKHAGITALAALAFMQAGNLPGRGKYGQNVQRALEFVLASSQESGLVSHDQSSPPMYGHGFATLFLAEVYGMTGDEVVKEKLQKAIRLIQRTQNPQGGWRYMPVPYDADISVTICQVMALRAARDAGIKVERDVIDKATEYVKKCQNADGGFSYMLGMGGGGSGFARSAAGLASLYYAGIYSGDEVDRALKYLARFNARGGSPDVEGHFYYGHYYAVQAMFLAGGENWTRWFPAIRDQLIARQNARTGLWQGDFSEDYATAMALIILQMPNRYLPVYSGKGPGS
jgi:hypothetical protein